MRETPMTDFNAAVDKVLLKVTEVSQTQTLPLSLFPGDKDLIWRKAGPKRWEGSSDLISVVLHGFYVKPSKKFPQQLRASTCVKRFIKGVHVDQISSLEEAVPVSDPGLPDPEPEPEFLPDAIDDWEPDSDTVANAPLRRRAAI